MFIQTSLETLTAEFDSIADAITVNYPWGSLLRAVALPEASLLAKLAAITKCGGRVEIHINIHPFRNRVYAARLGLSDALLMADRKAFVAAYALAGLVITDMLDVSANPRETHWGKQLMHGSRQILRIRAQRPQIS